MKITLKKKNVDGNDALLIQFVKDGKKVTQAVNIGETIDLEEDLAYEVMHKYKGCFVQQGVEKSADADKAPAGGKGYAHKAMAAKSDKAAEAGE